MIEIWKEIQGYEGSFEASNLGHIKSLSRYVKHPKGGLKKIRERILKQQNGTNGYFIVSLNGVSKTVHRLVASAFILNSENKAEVNHIDGNKKNNRIDNLEWATISENRFHAYKNGLQKAPFSMLGRKGKNCPNSKSVAKILQNGEKVFYDSLTIAQNKTKIDRSSIRRCIVGQQNHAGGYKWEYLKS